MEKEYYFTVALSDESQRSVKATSPEHAYIRILNLILTRNMDVEVSYIVDEFSKKVYYDFEWAVIFNDGDSLERTSGSPPRYTASEVQEYIRGYARSLGCTLEGADKYFNNIVLKR